jgi:hypothetical protein
MQAVVRQITFLLALSLPAVAVAQTGLQSRGTPAAASLNSNAAQIARQLGLDSKLDQFRSLQAQRPAGTSPTLEEVTVRQELFEAVQASLLDVDSVLAELANEQSELGSLRSELSARRDKTVGRLTTAALLTGSGVGTVVSTTQFTPLSNTTQNVGNALGIGSGVASTILSVMAARAQNGPTSSVVEIPNMLAPLFGETPVLNAYYPPGVLEYLHSVPAGEDPSRGTRLEQLLAEWNRSGRLSAVNSAQRQQKIAALTSSDDPSVKVSIGDLTDRIAMLGDVAGRVTLMRRDLASFIRSYSASPVAPTAPR